MSGILRWFDVCEKSGAQNHPVRGDPKTPDLKVGPTGTRGTVVSNMLKEYLRIPEDDPLYYEQNLSRGGWHRQPGQWFERAPTKKNWTPKERAPDADEILQAAARTEAGHGKKSTTQAIEVCLKKGNPEIPKKLNR